jgi:hypothetical protein
MLMALIQKLNAESWPPKACARRIVGQTSKSSAAGLKSGAG